MTQKPNESEIDWIEKQLSTLSPLGDDRLVETILAQKSGNPIPSVLFSDQAASVPGNLHASCFSTLLPVLTGLGGTVLGAVVVFLFFTLGVSPRVEIREIVRYVPAETVIQEPETPTLPLPESKGIEKPVHRIADQIAENSRNDSWFPVVFPLLNPPRQEARKTLDLDEMIERQRMIAQNQERYPQKSYRFDGRKSEILPTNFNSEQYKALIEELSL